MPKAPNAPGFGRFEFRPGVNQFPNWRGMFWDSDPATIPANRIVNAENVRIENGVFKSRGGQSKLGTTTIAGANNPIKGIHDIEGESQGNVLVYGPAVPQTSNTSTIFTGYVFNRSLGTLTPVMDPSPGTGRHSDLPSTDANYATTIYSGIQGGWYHHTDSTFSPWAGFGTSSHALWYGGSPFFFDGAGNMFSVAHYGESLDGSFFMTDTDSRLYLLSIRDNKMSIRPVAHLKNVRSFDVALKTERIIVGAIDTVSDVLYMVSANKTPGELYRFDLVRGLSTINNTLPSNGASLHKIIPYADKLVLLGRTTIGSVDPTTGTYTSITMPAAQFGGQNFSFGGWAIYKGVLYLAADAAPGGGSYTGHIVSYNGASTATVRTAPGAVDSSQQYNGYSGLVVAPDGKLYTTLMHLEGGAGGNIRNRIEIFDGAAWTSSTVLWQRVDGSGADATGPMVTAGGNPYKNVLSVFGSNIMWDGHGFLLTVQHGSVGSIASNDIRLFYTKGYDFTTLFAASYPAVGLSGSVGAPRWGAAVRFAL